MSGVVVNNLIYQDLLKLSPSQLQALYTKLHLPPTSTTSKLKDYISATVSSSVTVKPILLQITDIENVTKSKINQIDELLGVINPNDLRSDQLKNSGKVQSNKKNTSRKNQLIRDVNMDDPGTGGASQSATGIHSSSSNYCKLTLMDYEGTLAYGIELSKLQFLNTAVTPWDFLGAKVVVQPGTKVIHNVLLLKNELTALAGGNRASGQPAAEDPALLTMNRVVMERLKAQLNEEMEQ